MATKTAQSPILQADGKIIVVLEAQSTGELRVIYSGWTDAQIFKPGERIEFSVARSRQVQAFRGGRPRA